MNKREMKDLIRLVCEEFHRETRFSVTEYAIEELFAPTIPHLEEVSQELLNENITTDFLHRSIRTVLNNARGFASERKRTYIGYQEIKESMDKECPYVFWC